MPARPSPAAQRTVAGVVVLAVLAGIAVWWLLRPDHERALPGVPPAAAASSSAPVATPTPSPSPTPTPTPSPSPSTSRCETLSRPLVPQTVTIRGVTREAVVVTPPREADGVPGAPPLTSAGKTQFAWDRQQGISPGDPAGNVLLNAHTWPDGSALGNRLLAGLQQGDRIVVSGAHHALCYQVTERVEVLASDGLARYYATDGPPQLAIVVCSGRRLGPGVWEKRTVWFASPTA